MFSALAEGHGNLHQKLHNFVALCPIINLGWSQDEIIVFSASNYNLVNTTLSDVLNSYIPSPSHISEKSYEAVCTVMPCSIFADFVKNMFGYNSPFDRNDRAMVEDHRNASGSSVKQLLHYAQSKRDQSFAQYDYGQQVNQLKYG